jgi:hypothetical protein
MLPSTLDSFGLWNTDFGTRTLDSTDFDCFDYEIRTLEHGLWTPLTLTALIIKSGLWISDFGPRSSTRFFLLLGPLSLFLQEVLFGSRRPSTPPGEGSVSPKNLQTSALAQRAFKRRWHILRLNLQTSSCTQKSFERRDTLPHNPSLPFLPHTWSLMFPLRIESRRSARRDALQGDTTRDALRCLDSPKTRAYLDDATTSQTCDARCSTMSRRQMLYDVSTPRTHTRISTTRRHRMRTCDSFPSGVISGP